MKIKRLFLVLIITFSCKNSSDRKEELKSTKEKDQKSDTIDGSEQPNKFTWSNLKDTLKIEGKSIVI
ncbi:hypothetical protein [Christiangramia portivictoriae]|uniref:hypothetical protein n=1 Tax=Christiangramia portivictoriae TaxID=326069 RepID=UPI00042729FF|nr:hypothetical protein [Christiangramia portivictoriae]